MELGFQPRRLQHRTTRGNAAMGVAASLLVHGVIAAAILGAAWGVARIRARDEAPVVLVADFFDPALAHSSAANSATAQPNDATAAVRGSTAVRSTAQQTSDATAANLLGDRLRALEGSSAPNAAIDGLARRFGATSPNGGADSTANTSIARSGATFAGLVAGNATKVAYVVDASGSMLGSFATLVDEVERSLARLEPTQQFTVICFRRDSAEALDGDSSLRPASQAARRETVEWLRKDLIPAGRSSPVEALAKALASGADCIFLLSTTITGPGRHELDRASLLALLEQLNPADPSSGRRRATIQCIQFLEVDPGGTLEAVAAMHFGEGGYRFISRSASGIDSLAAPPSP